MRTLRLPKLLLVVVAAAVATVLVADPAAAKGPRSASIDGPGLDAPIEEPDVGMSKLPALTGLYGALWTDTTIPHLDEAPATDLGPSWVITWDLGTYVDESGKEGGEPDLVRQTVYLYAAGGPLVHTEAGQPVYGQETPGGWYEAPSALRSMLVDLGIPAEADVADVAAPADDADDADENRTSKLAATSRSGGGGSPSSSDDAATAWIAIAGPLALAGAASFALLHVHRRRAARTATS